MLPKSMKACLKYCDLTIALSSREGKGWKLIRKCCIQRNLAVKSYNLKKIAPISAFDDLLNIHAEVFKLKEFFFHFIFNGSVNNFSFYFGVSEAGHEGLADYFYCYVECWRTLKNIWNLLLTFSWKISSSTFNTQYTQNNVIWYHLVLRK